jgi:hypothetical protein
MHDRGCLNVNVSSDNTPYWDHDTWALIDTKPKFTAPATEITWRTSNAMVIQATSPYPGWSDWTRERGLAETVVMSNWSAREIYAAG